MHKIKIDDLEIFGFHGVYEEEKKNGQFFSIKIEYIPREDIEKINDNIDSVTDYTDVTNKFIALFNKKRYSLIEVLTKELVDELFELYDFIYLKITVRKKIRLNKNNSHFITIEMKKKHE